MLDSTIPDPNAKQVEYCPVHHNFTRGPCDRCIEDGIEDFSKKRAAKELEKLEKELAGMTDDLRRLRDMESRTIEVISRLKTIIAGG
jgi:hypothetical protein